MFRLIYYTKQNSIHMNADCVDTVSSDGLVNLLRVLAVRKGEQVSELEVKTQSEQLYNAAIKKLLLFVVTPLDYDVTNFLLPDTEGLECSEGTKICRMIVQEAKNAIPPEVQIKVRNLWQKHPDTPVDQKENVLYSLLATFSADNMASYIENFGGVLKTIQENQQYPEIQTLLRFLEYLGALCTVQLKQRRGPLSYPEHIRDCPLDLNM
jgi:hypothetical protein